MAAIAGLRSSGDFGTDERPKNFREVILFRNPKGMAPIFALSSRAKKRTTDDPEFSWWDEPNTNIRLQASAEVAAGGTVITVDSVDPTATTGDALWGTAQHLKPGDILQVEKTESAAYDNEHLEVVSVLSPTQFTVKRGVAGTTAATIVNDAYLTMIGSAYAEGTDAPPATSRNPVKLYNYTQIFKSSYELTGTADKTRLRTGDAWSLDKKRKTFDHARDIEWAMMFGLRHETTGSNGKPQRYMGGLRSFIPPSRTTIFGSAVTLSSFFEAVYKVFDYDTGAGDERIMFCGNGALNVMNKLVEANSHMNINYAGPVTEYGMNFRKYIIPQGTLLLRTHPLLNQHPGYTNSAFILDFDSIRYVAMDGRDTKAKDDTQPDTSDVRSGFFQTECSLQVDRCGLTMAYLGQFN